MPRLKGMSIRLVIVVSYVSIPTGVGELTTEKSSLKISAIKFSFYGHRFLENTPVVLGCFA